MLAILPTVILCKPKRRYPNGLKPAMDNTRSSNTRPMVNFIRSKNDSKVVILLYKEVAGGLDAVRCLLDKEFESVLRVTAQ